MEIPEKRLTNISAYFFIAISMLINTAAFTQTWNQVGMDIDGEAAGDLSGWSVSLSANGEIVAVGAYRNDGNGLDAGHVRVYQLISGVWTQQGADIDGEAADDDSGVSVSLSADGETIAIGASSNDGNGSNAGHVRVYKLISGTWIQQGADLDGEAVNDLSGTSVSLSANGEIVAIGAYYNDGNGLAAGHVRVYQLISGVWTQQGADIDGEAAGDRSGQSVSLSADGKIVAIGAPRNTSFTGHVRVYKQVLGTWVQQGADIDAETAGDDSGWSVSLSADGETVAIGSPSNAGNGAGAGHVRIYQLISGTWIQQGTDIDGEAAGDRSGQSVSLSADGKTVAIGSYLNSENATNSGHTRIYKLVLGSWIQQGADIGGEAGGDNSGKSVSISADGETIAVGAPSNAGNGSNAGHVRVYVLNSAVGIVENSFEKKLALYPNPTKGNFSIDLRETYKKVTVVVRDVNGKQVLSNTFNNSKLVQIKLKEPAGVYLLSIEADSLLGKQTEKAIIRLVKE